MKAEGLRFFTDTYLTVIGLIIFFSFFVGLLFWVRVRAKQGVYQRLQSLPLLDGGVENERA